MTFLDLLEGGPALLYCNRETARPPLSAETRIERDNLQVDGVIGLLSMSSKLSDGVQASQSSSVHAPAVSSHHPLSFAVRLGPPSLSLSDIADLLL
jgi:hypothetical protein